LLGLAGDLHFGWSMLTQYILPNGAVAGLVTYLAGWGLNFVEYVSALPILFRWGFYACVFILAFALINHGRRWFTYKEAQQDRMTNDEPEAQELRILSEEDLRQRCLKLSAELFEFYRRQRENLDEQLQSDYMSRLYNDLAREQKRTELIERHSTWMVDRYGEQFGSRVLKLSDDLAKHNCITSADRNRFKKPATPQDIQYIAQRLDSICRRSAFDSQEYYEKISG
jgi:hypothetical protein